MGYRYIQCYRVQNHLTFERWHYRQHVLALTVSRSYQFLGCQLGPIISAIANVQHMNTIIYTLHHVKVTIRQTTTITN